MTLAVPVASIAARSLFLLLAFSVLAGCASVPPPPPSPPATAGPAFHGARRIVVVPAGDSQFTVPRGGEGEDTAERVFATIFKWVPQKRALIAIAQAVYQGVTAFLEGERAAGAVPRDVTPGTVVARAFAQTLARRAPFDQVVAMEREPVGDDRHDADAIVRLSVPSWGFVRVRDGQPPLVAGFADVRAHMVMRETGALLWQHEEDVTHPDRLFADALTRDRAAIREGMIEVLERAGRRLASELVYAQGGGR
jgi:hypothetical protein